MEKKEKKEVEKVEREFTVSLSPLMKNPRPKRAYRAINFLKKFTFKHFRIKAENVYISQEVNQAIWARGREHLPRKIEIKIVKEEEKASVYLKGEKIKKQETPEKTEKGKEEKKGKEPVKKEEQAKVKKEQEEELKKKKAEKKAQEKAAETTQIKRGGK